MKLSFKSTFSIYWSFSQISNFYKGNKWLILKKGLFKKNGGIYFKFFGVIMLPNNQGYRRVGML